MGSRWEDATDQLEYGLVTDAKSVYDALTWPTSTASIMSDKRTARDLAIIRAKNNSFPNITTPIISPPFDTFLFFYTWISLGW